MFEGNMQHDAQELLRCLLCYLEDAEQELHNDYASILALDPALLKTPGKTPLEQTQVSLMLACFVCVCFVSAWRMSAYIEIISLQTTSRSIHTSTRNLVLKH
jgi:hypothetical protein